MVVERRLVDVVGRALLADADDLACLLPPGLPDAFTTAELADGIGRPRRLGQQLAYCLRGTGLIEASGKRGRPSSTDASA